MIYRNEFGGDDHFNVDNDDNEIQYKRSLQSQVVATSWEMKHRNQVLEEQKLDKKSMSRNRRMFGHILGTLEKFKNEQSQRKDLVNNDSVFSFPKFIILFFGIYFSKNVPKLNKNWIKLMNRNVNN